MTFFLIAVLAIIALAFGAGGVCLAKSGQTPKTEISETTTGDTTTSTDEIRKQLQNLARSNPPKKLSMGAMCYDMAMPPNRVEFICLSCSNKTLYAAPPEKGWSEETQFLSWELDACRRLVREIKGLNIRLDESLPCKHCTPDTESRKLALIIEYADTGKTHRVVDITLNDLKLIKEFTEGSKVHKGDQDRETPLKNHLLRLEQLLGVSLKEE